VLPALCKNCSFLCLRQNLTFIKQRQPPASRARLRKDDLLGLSVSGVALAAQGLGHGAAGWDPAREQQGFQPGMLALENRGKIRTLRLFPWLFCCEKSENLGTGELDFVCCRPPNSR